MTGDPALQHPDMTVRRPPVCFQFSRRSIMYDEARVRFHHLLSAFSCGMLVTRTPDGGLRARPLAVAGVEENDDLWFVTRLATGKVTEVLKDPHVCVTFQDGARYLSVTGRAVVVCNAEKLQTVWRERWRTWFPDGPHDPQVVLLQVSAEEGEFWDRGGLAGVRYLFRAGRAYLAGEEYVPAANEHQKVNLQSPAGDR
jgi:general stress protein 26